jgi:SNF2 family DNA or RNA helicase
VSAPPQVGIDGQGRVAVRNAYPWHESIKDLPGAKWINGAKAWVLPGTPGSAGALLTILADAGAQVSPKAMALATEAATREDRRALAADESAPLPVLPWHEWLTTDPWPHQKRGINFLLGSSAAAIGAGMGTGKTLMAIGALNARGVERGLLVAPVATFGVFPRELRLHSARKWHTENGMRRNSRGRWRKLTLPQRWALIEELFGCGCGRAHLAIIGYEAMAKDPVASADLAALGVQSVIYDEVHRLKKASGAASWTAKSWVNQVACRWGMSGTLMPQGPWDVYGTFRALDPNVFGTNQTRFQARYIVMGRTRDGKEFPKDVFDDRKSEFSTRFHSISYVPVVDLQLPACTHKIESFELEPSARTLYDSIRDSGVAVISAEAGDERTVAPANAGVELLRFAQITGGSVTDDEGNVAVVSTAKVTALGGVLERVGCRKGGHDGCSRPEPVVVFCRFRSDLKAIEELCGKTGLRYAEVSGPRKDGLDEDSKMNPECDVLGAQIASGGVGVDLTRARVNVWYSVGFELWLFQQAQKRSHRPGQTRQVLNVYLIANNTIDADIYTALARKENVVESCTWAYLRGGAEGDVEGLPEMEVPAGTVAGEPVKLPEWLLAGGAAPREPANRELDAQAGALAAMGLEGF